MEVEVEARLGQVMLQVVVHLDRETLAALHAAVVSRPLVVVVVVQEELDKHPQATQSEEMAE